MLKVDYESFFSVLVSVIIALIPLMADILRNVTIKIKERKEKKMFELYCEKETDNFYSGILIGEIVAVLLGIIGAFLILFIIENLAFYKGYNFELEMGLMAIIIFTISVGLSLKMMTLTCVRKRLLGDCLGKNIILCSIVIINIAMMCEMIGGRIRYIGHVFVALYFLEEIVGLLHFQGRYIKYEFSSIKLFLDNGESIVCEEIEKIKRKKDYIIVENGDRCIILQYHKIWRVEYYGLPKFILNKKIRIPLCFGKLEKH